jgi:hypothetical protein
MEPTMNPNLGSRNRTPALHRLIASSRAGALTALVLAGAATGAGAQLCPGTTLRSDLKRPQGITRSDQGNILVAETGDGTLDSGRISILSPTGQRRTLIDRLPSGLSDVSEPAGPSGVAMRGRTLYVAMGIGDSVIAAPIPTRHLPNPDVSSPLFSSVLAIHVSTHVERATAGFTLSLADQQALADGEKIRLSSGGDDAIDVELVADFPDYVPEPLPDNPSIVRGSNPFAIVVVADRLYVTDGGRNLVWQVSLATGEASPLTSFAALPNPLPVGGLFVEAVPTGIEYANGALLVTLFRGVPFPPGMSSVVQVDPSTGHQSPFISGLKTAIGVVRTKSVSAERYFVLQHSSGQGLFFSGPGVLLRFDSPAAGPIVLADCLSRPASMLLDAQDGVIYVVEVVTGRLLALRLGSS